MSEQEKIAMLEEALDLEEGTLSPETILDEVNSYDSMAKLSLIVLFDDEFGKTVTGEMIKSFVTVEDILTLMEK